MVSAFVSQATGRFDQRFFLSALVPTSVFVPAIAATITESIWSLSDALDWYTGLPITLQIVLWTVVAAVVWFVATLISGQLRNVVRLYEGYPLLRVYDLLKRATRRVPVLSRIPWTPFGLNSHRRKWEKLRRSADLGDAASGDISALSSPNYPEQLHRVLPTSLGNVIRSAEDYAWHRYGFDIICLWPRLAAVVPPDYLADVEAAMIQYQTPLVVSLLSSALSVASLGLLLDGVPWQTFAVVFFGSMAFSWCFYRLSFPAARGYGSLLKSAVDLYRNDLLARWWPELLHVGDDRIRLEALRNFVLYGDQPMQSGSRRGLTIDGVRSRVVASLRTIWRQSGDPPATPVATGGSRPQIPRLAFRLSLVVLLLAGLVGGFGVWTLRSHVLVLEAHETIEAYSTLSDKVRFVSRERGDVADGAVRTTDDAKDEDLEEAKSKLALRRFANNTQLTSADIGPASAGGASDLIVELERSRLEVSALDLRPGDRVVLSAAEPEGLVPDACGPPPRRSVGADPYVVAIVESSKSDTVSIVLQVDDLTARMICLAGSSGVVILRAAS